jgi:hypothetical protein
MRRALTLGVLVGAALAAAPPAQAVGPCGVANSVFEKTGTGINMYAPIVGEVCRITG